MESFSHKNMQCDECDEELRESIWDAARQYDSDNL